VSVGANTLRGTMQSSGSGQPPPHALRSGAIALEEVTRRFAAQLAVDRLSLTVEPGELLALLGASGSGKTTTLRLIAGLERVDAGRILLDGAVLNDVPPEGRGFGMVFQHYALFPHLSVEENVAFGLEARAVPKDERVRRARAALAAVGLEHKSQRPVQALSGGEQQRVALARATVIEPRVLLLDEPLSNLDPTLRETMRDELRDTLQRSGATTVFVTHDQDDAFAVADRVALLAHGRLLQIGTPEELYSRPANRAVAEFVGRGTLVPAADEGDTVAVTIGGRTMRARAWRSGNAPARYESALAVLRPESLALSSGPDPTAWTGRVTHVRFAGATYACAVSLDDRVTCEVTSNVPVSLDDEVSVRIVSDRVAVVGV
jgi:putative spermidine/putrescine transport system ATP-binding protein